MRYKIIELSDGGAQKSILPIIYNSEKSAYTHKRILEKRHPECEYIVIEEEY